jgi:TetR/AcrR family transcriptional regulator|tara:strand:- start:5913 stop:6581 length:669 start_codon:yes stop_codon:yes gene_type:complete
MSENKTEQKMELSKGAISILNVAESLFAQKGFKATSISEIAKNTGVSKANIYHHFKSKEHLYQEALELACDRVFNVMELTNSLPSVDPRTRLKEYVSFHLKSMLEQPDSTNLIKRELMDNNQIEEKMLAKDIFTNTFTKVASLVFDVHQIDSDSQDINASLQAFMLIAVNVFFFDSQSVMKYLPGVSAIADTPEVFSHKIFDFIINTSSQNMQNPTMRNSNE